MEWSLELGDAATALHLQVDVKAEILHSDWMYSVLYLLSTGRNPNALLLSDASLQPSFGRAPPLGILSQVMFPNTLGVLLEYSLVSNIDDAISAIDLIFVLL